jgi:hypothetical protein
VSREDLERFEPFKWLSEVDKRADNVGTPFYRAVDEVLDELVPDSPWGTIEIVFFEGLRIMETFRKGGGSIELTSKASAAAAVRFLDEWVRDRNRIFFRNQDVYRSLLIAERPVFKTSSEVVSSACSTIGFGFEARISDVTLAGIKPYEAYEHTGEPMILYRKLFRTEVEAWRWLAENHLRIHELAKASPWNQETATR